MTTNETSNLGEQRQATLSLLTGPVVWFTCFALVYLITGTGCTLEYANTSISGLNTLRLLAVSVTLLAAILVTWSAFLAMRKWRALHRMIVPASALPLRQRQEFLYLAGFVLSLVSLVAILWLTTAVIMNPFCL